MSWPFLILKVKNYYLPEELFKVIFVFLFIGPKPSELFGRYTWKIEKFSQINKRELRSSPFEVGGYKWYEVLHIIGLT